MDIKELIRQHGKSVAFVFKQMGIKAPVTPKEVTYAVAVYQGRFIDALENQIAIDEKEWSGANGDEIALMYKNLGVTPPGTVFPVNGPGFGQTQTLSTVVVAPKSKKAKTGLLNVLNGLATAAGTYLGAKKAAQQNGVAAPAAPLTPEEEKKKKTNLYLIAGAVLFIIILSAIALSIKKK